MELYVSVPMYLIHEWILVGGKMLRFKEDSGEEKANIYEGLMKKVDWPSER